MLTPTHSQPLRYGVAVLTTALALVFTLLSHSLLQPVNTSLFLAAVVVAVWFGGRKAGLLATVLSVLATDYFLIEPIYSLSLTSWPDFIQILVFGLVALLISLLTTARQTSRKQAKTGLLDLFSSQASQEQYWQWPQIVEQAGWGVAIGSDDGKSLLMVNPAFAHMYGYTVEEMTSKPLADIFAPESVAELPKRIQITYEQGHYSYEAMNLRKDGSLFPVRINATAVKDQSGNVLYRAVNVQDISDDKRFEQALQQQAEAHQSHHQWLEAILNLMPVPVLFIDPETGKFTFANRAAAEMAGGQFPKDKSAGEYDHQYSCTDATGQLIPPEQLPAVRVTKGEKIHGDELNWHTPKGFFPLMVYADTIPAMHSHPAICVMVFQDISDRKQAEEENSRLLECEKATRAEALKVQQQLTTIFETSPVGIGFLDREQRFVAINEALAEINGLSRKQHLGHTIPELFSQSDPELVTLFHQLYLTGEPFISPQLAINVPGRSDRRPGYYNVHYLPTVPQGGRVEGVLIYVVDVTERVRLERGRQYLSEASTVLASSLDYQTTLEQVAQLTVPNLADWCTVHVREQDGLIQQLAVAHIDPAKVAWAEELAHRYPINGNESRGAGFTLRTGQSDIISGISDEMLVQGARDPDHLQILRQVGFSSVMTVPLRNQEQILGVISFVSAESGKRYDKTDLMFAEELARRASLAIDNARLYQIAQQNRAKAETANRVKDEFLAVLSHELRTPLNAILGWSQLLRSRKFEQATAAHALEIIERNAKLQTQLIEDLLDVSRILRGKLSLNVCPVDLKLTICDAIETVRLSAQAKSIQIQTLFAPGVGQVIGDPNRLQQVVWNLLSNAVKFTPEGGRVDIQLERVGSQAQITVSDTGKGIQPDFLPYVFDYFRQADSSTTRKFGGLGLGLAIVRSLVELHGGTVQVESPGEGQGAAFTVKLPLTSAAPKTYLENGQSEFSGNLKGMRILVVDDETDMREFLAFALEQYGATVTTVPTAATALEVLDQFKPDILISDIGMPEIDGYMLMRQVRALPPEQGGQVLAIALTAYASETDQQRVLSVGFQKHVTKPVEASELAVAITSLVEQAMINIH